MTSRIYGLISAAALVFFTGSHAAWGQTPGQAQDQAKPPVPAAATTHTTYAVYIHGLHVVDASVAYQIQPWGYGTTASIHSVGLASLFIEMNLQARSEGRFTPTGVAPILYESTGFSRGEHRHVKITYKGDAPATVVVEPPEPDREPVPASDQAHTVDTLGGVANLIHQLTTTGRCEGAGNVFDGLRLSHLEFHGPVTDAIPEDRDSFYVGPGLRCDFVGQQLAGFIKDSPNREKMAQPEPGSAWFKSIDGFGLVPVRVEMEHPKLGHVTIVMQKAVQH